jgi:serine protease Do
VALCCVVLGGCSILGIGVRAETRSSIDPSAPVFVRAGAQRLVGVPLDDLVVLAQETRAQLRLDSGTFRRVAEEATAAVVNVYTETASPYRVSLLPIPVPGTSFRVALPGRALGSAFFVHPGGYLLTNNHVIEDATSIKANMANGKTYTLSVLARDPALDLALLAVTDRRRVPEFPYIPLGDSAEVAPGDLVIAIGNPLGLGHTVTQGIISQTGRRIAELERSAGGRHIAFLQTSAPINPGSSGGPLITLAGAAIGVNAVTVVGAQGIGFTIPSEQVRGFVGTVLGGGGVAERDP